MSHLFFCRKLCGFRQLNLLRYRANLANLTKIIFRVTIESTERRNYGSLSDARHAQVRRTAIAPLARRRTAALAYRLPLGLFALRTLHRFDAPLLSCCCWACCLPQTGQSQPPCRYAHALAAFLLGCCLFPQNARPLG